MTTRDVNPFIRLAPASGNPFVASVDDSPESEAVSRRAMAKSVDNIADKYRGPVDDPGSMDLPSEMAPQTPSMFGEVAPPVDAIGDKVDKMQEARIKELAAKARVIKARMASDKEEFDGVKVDLWEAVGARPVKKLHGVTFRPPNGKRSTDLKGLEADHPDIYAQYVTETDPDPTEPGALYL